MENEQMASELSLRIAALANFEGDSLKLEMMSLKQALLENPAACLLLQDSDIGLAVKALRRMTGLAAATATAPKPRQKKVVLNMNVPDEDFL